MSLTRRSFLTKTAGGILVAPALIREGFAMPVKSFITPALETYHFEGKFEIINDGYSILINQTNGDWKIWQGP